MAIFDRIPQRELGVRYTHRGWFCGLCPVYIGDLNTEAPLLAARNWVPDWMLDLTTGLFGVAIFLRSLADDNYDPAFPIRITGELPKEQKC